MVQEVYEPYLKNTVLESLEEQMDSIYFSQSSKSLVFLSWAKMLCANNWRLYFLANTWSMAGWSVLLVNYGAISLIIYPSLE